jgi:hypothetical protein
MKVHSWCNLNNNIVPPVSLLGATYQERKIKAEILLLSFSVKYGKLITYLYVSPVLSLK